MLLKSKNSRLILSLMAFALFFLFEVVNAQTNVSGIISNDTTWSLNGSPYIITGGDVQVPAGITLTIEPGVEIQYDGAYEILVKGNVIAVGNSDNIILFTSSTPNVSSGATMFRFMDTDLSESQFNYLKMELANKAIFTDVGNTDTLNISNLQLLNNKITLGTNSYDSPRGVGNIILSDSKLLSSNIDVNNSFFRLENSKISNSNINLNYASSPGNIIIQNCLFKNSIIYSSRDAWGGPINIYCSKLLNSSIKTGSVDCNLLHSYLINSPVEGFTGGTLKIIDSKVIFNGEYGINCNTSDYSKNCSIQGSQIIGNNDGIGVNMNNGMVKNCEINNTNIAVKISTNQHVSSSGAAVTCSNFFRNNVYNIENITAQEITADSNYWDYSDSSLIAITIFDYYDDINYGIVDFSEYLSNPDNTVPISPPSSAVKSVSGSNVEIKWNCNPETDLAGYKVYYGDPTGYSFSNVVDVGIDTSYLLSGVSILDSIAVTAYDINADNIDDQIEGHESWFSYADLPELDPVIVKIDSVISSLGDTLYLPVNVEIPDNYSFSSLEVSIGGYLDKLDLLDIDFTNSLVGTAGWSHVINETDTALFLAVYGTEDITGSGALFQLKFSIPDTSISGFVPVTLLDATFNTGDIPVELNSGGVFAYESALANFIGEPTQGVSPLSVTFSDLSTGDINSWKWNFGDGEDRYYTSFASLISHTYENSGNYSVSLVVTSPANKDTLIKEDYILVQDKPDFGDVDLNGQVQAYDASKILKYLVDYIDLNNMQLINAEVSGNDTITAYDASLIAQYVVHLIDVFPADTGSFSDSASGKITMDDDLITPGDIVEIPLILNESNNIFSFEGLLKFNPEHLIFDSLEWSESASDFLTEVKIDSGLIKFAGAGTVPDIENNTFAILKLVVNEVFNENETILELKRLRWNEGPINEDVASSKLTNVVSSAQKHTKAPKEFYLGQNYPNPFNPITTIRYDVPKTSDVILTIYNTNGQVVDVLINQKQEPGFYQVKWDASKVGTGVYFYHLKADDFKQVGKCLLLK